MSGSHSPRKVAMINIAYKAGDFAYWPAYESKEVEYFMEYTYA